METTEIALYYQISLHYPLKRRGYKEAIYTVDVI